MSCSRGFIAAVLFAVCFGAIVGDGTVPAQQDGLGPKASIDPAEAVQIIGKPEVGSAAQFKWPPDKAAAAVRTADVDRGKSLRASTDRAEILEIVGEVAPGFTAKLPVIPGGVAIVAEHFGRKRVLSTHPLDPVTPCILSSTIEVPANKRTTLTFDVSHSKVGDWKVIVLANGVRLFDSDVDKATAPNGWLSVSVDLTRFAGKKVVLELQNQATGWSHEWGYWDKVKITARMGSGPPSTPERVADALTPQQEKELWQEAKALNERGRTFYDQARYEEALPCMEQALAKREQLYSKDKYPKGHPELAISLSNLGDLMGASGELIKAVPYHRKSLEMRQKLFPADKFPRGHPTLALSLNNLGGSLQARGELAKAEPYFRQALAMRQAIFRAEKFPQGHLHLAISLNTVGFLLQTRGELAKAEPYYRQALEMYQRLCTAERFPFGHPDWADSLDNLGFVLQARGELAKAEPYYRQALEMREKLYRADPAGVLPQGHPRIAQSLNSLGFLLQARGELAEAELQYRRSLKMNQRIYPADKYPQGHPEVARSLNNLGFVLQARGELAKAELSYRQSLEMHQKLYPADKYPQGQPELARSLNNLGHLLQVRGEWDKAEPFLRQAVDMYRDLLGVLAELSSETEALNFAASLPSSRDHYLAVTAQLPEDAKVYARIWQGKGALMRIATRHHQDFLATQNDEAIPRVNALSQVRLELNRAINQPLPDASKQAERMRELTQKKEDLEKAIARALHLEAPSSQQTPTPEELRRLLPARTVFVDYLRYYRTDYDQGKALDKRVTRMPHYVAFVLTRDHPVKRIELGPANVIEEDLKIWRQAIVGKGASVADARLGERLWKPLLECIPGDTEVVYLAPDGDLTRLPWPALPGRDPDKVLLEEHALAVVPHGLFLLQQMQHKPRSDKEEGLFLAYGAIRYDQPPGAVDQKAVEILALNQDRGSEGHVGWQSLAGTARELDQVLNRAGRRKLKTLERRGSQASLTQLIDDLPKARWAHFATHGFFADADSRSILQLTPADYERSLSGERIQVVGRSPLLLSGIVLAGANRKNQDGDARFDPDGGIITGEGLIGLRLEDLDLAVLSACETGLGEVAGGEGVFGLQRSFHVAGTRNVVASFWKVDDDATAALMTLFYHKLWVETRPPLVALREAQLHIYRHPEQIASLAKKRGLEVETSEPQPAKNSGRAATWQWAAFTLSGLGRTATPLADPEGSK